MDKCQGPAAVHSRPANTASRRRWYEIVVPAVYLVGALILIPAAISNFDYETMYVMHMYSDIVHTWGMFVIGLAAVPEAVYLLWRKPPVKRYLISGSMFFFVAPGLMELIIAWLV